jgi:Glycosyl transferase family 2
MRVYGLMVAQNEGDIISDTLRSLGQLNLFENIFFYDLGSEDDTLEKAQQFGDLLNEPQSLDRVYTEGLRFELLASHRSAFEDGDWLAIVDADEMYAEDPRPLIDIAEHEHATSIGTYQCEFMLTDRDLESIADEDPTQPISSRRKRYLIQWSEDRFFKFVPAAGVMTSVRPCSRKFLNRHYQYRTAAQIALRIRTRLANRAKAHRLSARQTWPQIFSEDWRDYIVPNRLLHCDTGGELRFGLPDGVQWKDYYSPNPFSTIFPQVARKLAFERKRATAALAAPLDVASEVAEAGNRSDGILRDDYRSQVMRELCDNVQGRRWGEAGRAVVVLLRHLLRWCRRTLRPAIGCVGRRIKENVHWRIVALASSSTKHRGDSGTPESHR